LPESEHNLLENQTRSNKKTAAKSSFVIKALSIIPIIIALIVIYGWLNHNYNLVQISPTYAPIQLNTALGFIFGGLSFLCFGYKKYEVSKLFAIPTILLGILSMAEYMFHLDFDIDLLFTDSHIPTGTPDSMIVSPTAPLCFIITGIAILFIKNRIVLLSLYLLLSAIIVMTLISYFLNAGIFYGFASLTHMDIQETAGFLIFLTIFTFVLKEKNNDYLDIWKATPYASALILMTLTLFAWQLSQEFIKANNKEHFHKIIADNTHIIKERFSLYKQALRGGLGLLEASDDVNADEWRSYVDALSIKENLPGTNGIGFIDHVDKANLPEYLEKLSNEKQTPFKNHPETKFNDKYIIRYIEPLNINKEAVGLDIGFEEHRREGAEYARDTGRITLTKIIHLVQDNKKLPGFLLLNPYYEKGTNPQTVEDRRKYFKGMVYSPFMGRKFVTDIRTTSNKEVEFEVYDGYEINKKNLIHQNNILNKNPDLSYLKTSTRINLAERTWTIMWHPSKSFIQKNDNTISYIILVIGAMATILFSGFFYILSKRYGVSAKESQENKERFELAVRGSSVGLWDWKMHNNELYWSPRFMEIVGISDKDFIPEFNSFMDRVHPEEKDFVEKSLYEHLEQRIPYDIEYRIRHNSGHYIWIHARGQAIWDDDGNAIRMAGSVDDVTKRINFQDEIKKANNELESFTYIVSHDLRSPLINLKGYSAQLEKYIKQISPIIHKISPSLSGEENNIINKILNDRIPQAVDFINSGVDKMDSMTNAILKLSRTGRRELRFVNINTKDIVKNYQKIFAHQLKEKNAKIHIGDLPVILGDKTSIDQIFGNLIDNAIKYLSDDKKGKIEISCSDKGSHYEFKIIDNGRGIDEKDFDKVFAVFRRASNASETEGEGMGLNYVKSLIQRHGGEIIFNSKINEGSEFIFTIYKNINLTESEDKSDT